jgi:hypothetical protein
MIGGEVWRTPRGETLVLCDVYKCVCMLCVCVFVLCVDMHMSMACERDDWW